MLDIRFIRENKDLIQAGAKKKRLEFDVAKLLEVDEKRRKLTATAEKKRAEQNSFNEKIVKATLDAKAGLISEMKSVKEALQKDEVELAEVMKNWQLQMLQVPNLPDMSVPEGASDAENVEVRSWGEIPKFDFVPKGHIELMLSLNMIDLDRGAKVSGFRGYYLKNDAVRLNFAIWQYALVFFSKRGFETMLVPAIAKKENLMGTGYLPQGEEDLYKTQDGDYLAGTAEVATMGYLSGEVLDKSELPKKFLSFSESFRREAGSHGKDTKGLMRVHEFYKWEQVVLCEASHEVSVKFHEELTKNAEEFLQSLGLAYHVVVNCGGDLGLGQVKKYDIETWVPSENKYRETHSSSYFHDFQTRRLNIRYKDSDGKMRFAHSLNNTAIATPRIIIQLVENYQQADGSIVVPEVLRLYFGKDKIGPKL